MLPWQILQNKILKKFIQINKIKSGHRVCYPGKSIYHNNNLFIMVNNLFTKIYNLFTTIYNLFTIDNYKEKI